MPCPEHAGKHPFHDYRYIVTEDAEINQREGGDWGMDRGEIVCVMRDGPPYRALLVAQAPKLRADLDSARGALSACLEQIYQMRGMFPDDDGAIAAAVAAGEAAL